MNHPPKTICKVVEIRHLTKRYGDFVAVDDLSLHVDRGGILGFIGPNGAGKTTTIKILVGLSRPTSGVAEIEGVNCLTGSKKIKHLVGYMPDRFGSYDNMRVHEYLDFFAATFGIPRSLRKKRIDEVLQVTSSEYMRDRFVESLSHGMQQRIGIARVLLHDPAVLILDEPANGLDPQARIEMRELLLRLAAAGKTLIVTSHILAELSRICSSVAIITHGKLRAFGSLDDVMRALCPRRQFEIQLLDGADLERIESLLREFGNADMEIQVSPKERLARFSSQFDETKLAELLGQLVSNNIRVVQFREVPTNLEDAFMSAANARG